MKRAICALLFMYFLFATAIAESVDLSTMSENELRDLKDRIDIELANRSSDQLGETVIHQSDEYTIVYKSHFFIRRSNRLLSVVELSFTNNSSSEQSHLMSSLFDEYQNGVWLDHPLSTKGYETYIRIRPGYTSTVYLVCIVRDENAPIELVDKGTGFTLLLPIEKAIEE